MYARGVEPTGRTLWVKVDKYEHGVELLPGLPKQVEYTKWSQEPNRKIRHRETLVPYRGKNNLVRVDGIHNPPGLAQLSTSRSAWGPLATMAALPALSRGLRAGACQQHTLLFRRAPVGCRQWCPADGA